MTATHTLPTRDKGYCLSAEDRLRIEGRTYSAGMIARGQEGRQVTGGPMVAGPFAWLNESPVVIAAHYIAGPTEHDAAEGDLVIMDGETYVIGFRREAWQSTRERGRPALLLVEAHNDPTDCPDCGRSQGWNGHPYRRCGRSARA